MTPSNGDNERRNDAPEPRRPGRPLPPGRTSQPGPRGFDDRPPSGRDRVPNRPASTRGRSQREKRAPVVSPPRPDEWSAQDWDQPQGVTSTGAGDGSGGSRRAGTGSTTLAPDRTRPARPARKKQAASRRGRRTARDRVTRVNTRLRTRVALGIVLVLLAVALGKLVTIQTVDASALTAAGLDQTQRTYPIYGQRGSIDDRNGAPLAFSVAGKQIAARPANFQNDAQRAAVADVLVAALGSAVDRAKLLGQLESKQKYVYLARDVMPEQSAAIMAKIALVMKIGKPAHTEAGIKLQTRLMNAVVTEDQPIRTDSDGTLATSVVGTTIWDGRKRTTSGESGLEAKFDSVLKSTDGSRTLRVDSSGLAIPGSVTDLQPAADGTSLKLTLDQDMQYSVAKYLAAQVTASQAKGGCAVVKGISDGQIYAITCDYPRAGGARTANRAISTPFEPGSVNKVVTFAAALDRGLIKPDSVLNVPGQISMGGREIHDAWSHSPVNMTATGILAVSSNVGTLMIAQKVGPTAFAQELAKYGLGRKTGIELPNESAGSYPAQSQWSATSFANLPIGQGVSMTLLQLVDMYQAIGNKGVMVSPTIIAGTTKNGVYTPSKPTATRTVMKPTTATTLLDMLRGTVQAGGWGQHGTAPKAAITGYQVAGKTGTAQQINPVTHAYSQSITTATFAGIVPADKPKFAIAIMIDAPVNGSEGGDSAAPLFHEIASYVLRAADVPPSATAAPIYNLYVQ